VGTQAVKPFAGSPMKSPSSVGQIRVTTTASVGNGPPKTILLLQTMRNGGGGVGTLISNRQSILLPRTVGVGGSVGLRSISLSGGDLTKTSTAVNPMSQAAVMPGVIIRHPSTTLSGNVASKVCVGADSR